MAEVGIRALKQNASAVVAQAAAGEAVTITDHGRPVALLGPIAAMSPLEQLRASGAISRPKRELRDLGRPLPSDPSQPTASEALRRMRDAERY